MIVASLGNRTLEHGWEERIVDNLINRLLDLSSEELRDLVHARARRRFNRGLKRKPMGLIKKLRKAKKEAKPNEKPEIVKTHLRDMIIVPEMIGSVIGIYSGKEFNQVEIKPEMVGHYLGEFSISYKPVKHGRPGIGATHSSRFIPLSEFPHFFSAGRTASNHLQNKFVVSSGSVYHVCFFCYGNLRIVGMDSEEK